MSTSSAVLDDIQVIDADTHVIEPYDLWTSRVSQKRWGDKVPHVVWDEERQADVWVAGNEVLIPAVVVAAAGYKTAPPYLPQRWSDIEPEVWSAEERLALMTDQGVYAAILYPNVTGFGAGRFADVAGAEGALALELIRAYNDFLVDFASADPSRYIPVMALPFWDLDLTVAEMERAVGLGHKGVIFSQQPELFGTPTLGSTHWDPLWAAAQEMELSINFHIGSGSMSPDLLPPEAGRHVNFAASPVINFIGNCQAIARMIGGGALHRFPELKIVSVESGVGWVPFAVQALDWMWKACRVTDEHPEFDLLPSEYAKRQVYTCFWFENGPTLQAAIDYLGEDHILYETDYPHPASMAPGPASSALTAREFIEQNLLSLNETTLRKVLHDNAAALYKLD